MRNTFDRPEGGIVAVQLWLAPFAALVVAALLLVGCSARSADYDSPLLAAEAELDATLADGSLPASLTAGDLSLGAPVQYYIQPADTSEPSFDALEPNIIVVPVMAAGVPVYEFMVKQSADGRYAVNGAGEVDTETYERLTAIDARYASAASIKVVGSHSGIWVAVDDGGRVFGVPIFNAEGSTREYGREYTLSEFGQ